MVNYTNSKIYKIVCNITGECYIGSTTQSLEQRLNSHKHSTNTCKSKQIIDRGDYKIVLIEELENCVCIEELHDRERYYIDNNCCINKKKPLSSLERENYSANYRATHKDYYDIKCANWRKNHPTYMKEKCKEWRDKKKNIKICDGVNLTHQEKDNIINALLSILNTNVL